MAIDDRPYHHTQTAFRITTTAAIRPREGSVLTDLLSIEEEIDATGARHVTSSLNLWLGNLGDPASTVRVCNRLIVALEEISQKNEELAAIDDASPAQGHEVVAEWTRPEGATS